MQNTKNLTQRYDTQTSSAISQSVPGKKGAREHALQLFPTQHELLNLKRHHGGAEAALIVVASVGVVA